MRYWILTIFAALLYISATAQLYVLSTNRQVNILRDGEWNLAFVSDRLFETDLLQTEPYGNIVIRDKKENKNYPVQSLTPQSVKELIAPLRSSTPSLTKEFGRGLDNLIRGLGSIRDLFPTTGGGVYKGEDPDMIVAKALLSRRNGSLYPITMKLLDEYTLQPMEQVREQQPVILEITNNSDTPLFFNIIDRDEKGTDTALISITELQTLGDLYIPAYSSVRLNSYPIKFSPANITDQLTLVAYPLPFNLSNVLEIIKNTDFSPEEVPNSPIGIYQTFVRITNL